MRGLAMGFSVYARHTRGERAAVAPAARLRKIAKQLQGASTGDLRQVALQCLKRNKGCVAPSRSALKVVKHETGGPST